MGILREVKHLFLFLIAAALLSSCTLTQRRYTSGYSVNWKHKASKTAIQPPSPIDRTIISAQIQSIPAKELSDITAPTEKWKSPAKLKPINSYHRKNVTSIHIASGSPVISSVNKVDKGQPHFYTGDEQEDDYARISLIYGILSLCSPAAGFLIMLGIVLSTGLTLAIAPLYSIYIFGAFCALGIAFSVLAILNGFHGINEINSTPDTYDGTGDAVLGILLACLLPIGLAAYLLIRFL